MIAKPDISSQVAEISTWSNNCAVSCTATFLVNAFLQKRLSEKAEETLVQLFNDHYKTYFLSTEQLRDIFSSVVTLPTDRQIILGPVLREFIYTKGIIAEEESMLSDEAFRPLAEAFDFNVVFYSDRDKKIEQSGVIPNIIVNQAFTLALRPYYHHSHYDLIMDDAASAQEHNRLSSEESKLNLAIEKGREEELKKQVNGFVLDRYNPEQQQILDKQIDILFGLAKNFQSSDLDDIIEDVTMLASGLKELTEVFFKAPISERPATIQAFKQKSMGLIQSIDEKIGGAGVLSWGWSFVSDTEHQKRQLHAALCALKNVITSVESESLEVTHASKKEETPWRP
jgi:hypothetical protein